MALLAPLYKVADICAFWGVRDVFICPGSRSAALTLAFSRNKNFRTHVVTDERSAGFVALGLAQASATPVVLICTSGTAALNFAPAIAEAYFQKVPLLILTADRPPEWIHQYDGQTIFQSKIFGKHVVKDYDFPVDYHHKDAVWSIERQTNEALAYTRTGPVHINIPVREPFYPQAEETYTSSFKGVKYLKTNSTLSDWSSLVTTWQTAGNIVIAVGQNHEPLADVLHPFLSDPKVTLVADIISNVIHPKAVSLHDLFLTDFEEETDLLLTLGKSFISKSLKQHFRAHPPAQHWHISEDTDLLDPLQSIQTKIPVEAQYFFKELASRVDVQAVTTLPLWRSAEEKARNYMQTFLGRVPWGELQALASIVRHLEAGDVLHLGNSMPVRYANYLTHLLPEGVKVYANRGTSGIEGVVSTAVGQALATSGRVHCIVGDISFFYDSNALFAALPANLHVYVVQNGGGNIFRIIEGPSAQAELEKCFITPQGRSAKHMAEEAGYTYYRADDLQTLELGLNHKEDGAALFEIYVDGVRDVQVLRQMKSGFTS
jgi:2-succinyl-5-enolpyruvyl-6-hydroxy-3-cyclohexene-1-carboxylate synthase